MPADKHIEWKIDDPKDKDISFFRKVRDEIKQKVKDLSAYAYLIITLLS